VAEAASIKKKPRIVFGQQVRTNRNNDGRAFQDEVLKSAGRYVGKLRLRKVDPPVRLLGGGEFRKVIFQKNPFSDFIGCWTERGGQMLCVECKSTSEPKLQFGNGGVTDDQIDQLINWSAAGAVAFVLWQWRMMGVRLIPSDCWKRCRDSYRAEQGFRHIKWESLPLNFEVKQGLGFCTVDFLMTMRAVYYDERS